MKCQPSLSPIHFSTPPTEDSPPPSPSGDHANADSEHVDVPMASPTQFHKESEDLSTRDAPPQDNTGMIFRGI